MAKFIATIQLEDAGEEDYVKLYRELEKKSFERGVHAGKGKKYVNDKGKYKWEGKVTIQDVTKAILKAVVKTGKKYSFTIIREKAIPAKTHGS